MFPECSPVSRTFTWKIRGGKITHMPLRSRLVIFGGTDGKPTLNVNDRIKAFHDRRVLGRI
jgi:hypothetical protein